MKFAAVVIALTAASVAAAGPISFEARDSTAVELNDIDTAAIEYLVRRGLFDESALEARGLFGGGSTDLHITFHDPTGSISAGRKKEATKALKKAVSKADQKKYPYCDVTYVSPLFPWACRDVGAKCGSLFAFAASVTAVLPPTAASLLRRRRSASRAPPARSRSKVMWI